MNRQSWVVIGLIAFLLILGGRFYFKTTPEEYALKSRALAAWGLADYLAKNQKSGSVVAISSPFAKSSSTNKNAVLVNEAGLVGLREVFSELKVAVPRLKPGAADGPYQFIKNPEVTTPLGYLLVEKAFDELARQHPSSNLFISLVGIPEDLLQSAAWTEKNELRFAFLFPDFRILGSREEALKFLKSEKFAACVLVHPLTSRPMTKFESDRKVAFEKRFVLITPQNVDQLLKQFPRLL